MFIKIQIGKNCIIVGKIIKKFTFKLYCYHNFLAKKLINIAKLANADFVKFQIFKADDLVTKNHHCFVSKKYWKNISQHEMLLKSILF